MTTSQEKKKDRKAALGFSIFAVVAIFVTYLIGSTLNKAVSGPTGGYIAYFNDASGLLEGDDVRMAGVRVGRINDVKLDNGRARVSFEVQTDQPIYTNTKAAIRYQNLIGQRYLALSIDRSRQQQPLPDGAALELPSEDSFDVTALLRGFQPVFETIDAEQVNQLSEGLIKTFQGDDVSLSNTLAEIGQVADDMADRDAVIGAVITNLSVVMRDLSAQGAQVGTLLDSMSALIENLNTDSAQFGQSISQIGETAQGFAEVLGDNRAELRSVGTQARVATERLIGVGAQLDQTAVQLPIFLGHFPLVLGQGAYLNIYPCELDISIGNVLFPPGLITQIGSTDHSQVCQ